MDGRETDSLAITSRDDPMRESVEVRPGVIVDVGDDGRVVRFEIRRASTVAANPGEMELALSEQT